jgi:hypothetical protein
MRTIQEIIQEQLERLEQTEQIRILHACESGSRAWGFPSRDSDYDVRFIYIRQPDWYLSIFEKRDVIELPINDSSISTDGWDLRKTEIYFANQTRRCLNGCSRRFNMPKGTAWRSSFLGDIVTSHGLWHGLTVDSRRPFVCLHPTPRFLQYIRPIYLVVQRMEPSVLACLGSIT